MFRSVVLSLFVVFWVGFVLVVVVFLLVFLARGKKGLPLSYHGIQRLDENVEYFQVVDVDDAVVVVVVVIVIAVVVVVIILIVVMVLQVVWWLLLLRSLLIRCCCKLQLYLLFFEFCLQTRNNPGDGFGRGHPCIHIVVFVVVVVVHMIIMFATLLLLLLLLVCLQWSLSNDKASWLKGACITPNMGRRSAGGRVAELFGLGTVILVVIVVPLGRRRWIVLLCLLLLLLLCLLLLVLVLLQRRQPCKVIIIVVIIIIIIILFHLTVFLLVVVFTSPITFCRFLVLLLFVAVCFQGHLPHVRWIHAMLQIGHVHFSCMFPCGIQNEEEQDDSSSSLLLLS